MSYRRLLLIIGLVIASQQVQGASAAQTLGNEHPLAQESQSILQRIARIRELALYALPARIDGPIDIADCNWLLAETHELLKESRQLYDAYLGLDRGSQFNFAFLEITEGIIELLKRVMPAPVPHYLLPEVDSVKKQLDFSGE